MSKNSLGKKIAVGAAAGIAIAAAAATAAAVLSNKKLRNNLGKQASSALEIVSKLALQFEEKAEEGIRVIESTRKKLAEPKPGKQAKH